MSYNPDDIEHNTHIPQTYIPPKEVDNSGPNFGEVIQYWWKTRGKDFMLESMLPFLIFALLIALMVGPIIMAEFTDNNDWYWGYMFWVVVILIVIVSELFNWYKKLRKEIKGK